MWESPHPLYWFQSGSTQVAQANSAQTTLEEIAVFLAACIHHEFQCALSVFIYMSLCVCMSAFMGILRQFQVLLKAFEVSWPEKIRYQGAENYFKNF